VEAVVGIHRPCGKLRGGREGRRGGHCRDEKHCRDAHGGILLYLRCFVRSKKLGNRRVEIARCSSAIGEKRRGVDAIGAEDAFRYKCRTIAPDWANAKVFPLPPGASSTGTRPKGSSGLSSFM